MGLERRGWEFLSKFPLSWLMTTVIMIELEDRTEVDFAPALYNVEQMWEELIEREGL